MIEVYLMGFEKMLAKSLRISSERFAMLEWNVIWRDKRIGQRLLRMRHTMIAAKAGKEKKLNQCLKLDYTDNLVHSRNSGNAGLGENRQLHRGRLGDAGMFFVLYAGNDERGEIVQNFSSIKAVMVGLEM